MEAIDGLHLHIFMVSRHVTWRVVVWLCGRGVLKAWKRSMGSIFVGFQHVTWHVVVWLCGRSGVW
jgi:hypothetical protein